MAEQLMACVKPLLPGEPVQLLPPDDLTGYYHPLDPAPHDSDNSLIVVGLQNEERNGDSGRSSSSRYPPLPVGRSWQERTLGPLGPGSMRSSVTTLVSSAIGAGVLAMPYAFAQMGLVVGVIVTLLSALGTYVGLLIVGNAMVDLRVDTYNEVLAKVSTPAIGMSVDLTVALNGIGNCVSYMVFIGDFLPSSLLAMGCPELFCNRALLLFLSALTTLPFTLKKRLSSFRHAATIPTLTLLATCGILLFKSPHIIAHRYQKGGAESEVVYPMARWSWNFWKSMNCCMFAYYQHQNICPVIHEMVEPSRRRAYKTTSRSVLIETLLFLTVAFCGFFTYGQSTQQNVLRNYPQGDWLFVACRLLLTACMIVNIPLNLLPSINSILELSRNFLTSTPGNDDTYNGRVTVSDFVNAGVASVMPTSAADVVGANNRRQWHQRQVSAIPVDCPGCSSWESYRLCLVFGSTTGILLTALATDKVADVIGVVAGLFSTALMFTFPAIVHFQTFRTALRLKGVKAAMLNGMIVAGLLLASLMTFSSVFVVAFQFFGFLPS